LLSSAFAPLNNRNLLLNPCNSDGLADLLTSSMNSGRLAYNRVFYRQKPEPGHRYRQIAILGENGFEVCIFEGDAIQTDPAMIAMLAVGNMRSHPDLEEAIADAEQESRKSTAEGWIRYRFTTPIARNEPALS
jgi:hypothetical protein